MQLGSCFFFMGYPNFKISDGPSAPVFYYSHPRKKHSQFSAIKTVSSLFTTFIINSLLIFSLMTLQFTVSSARGTSFKSGLITSTEYSPNNEILHDIQYSQHPRFRYYSTGNSGQPSRSLLSPETFWDRGGKDWNIVTIGCSQILILTRGIFQIIYTSRVYCSVYRSSFFFIPFFQELFLDFRKIFMFCFTSLKDCRRKFVGDSIFPKSKKTCFFHRR